MCVVSWPLAESWFFMTSGKSGGDEYAAMSNSSNSPFSSLIKKRIIDQQQQPQKMRLDSICVWKRFFFIHFKRMQNKIE